MIKLFHIPDYKIDTSQFSNMLSDKIVREFEDNFATYVGAKYAVSLHSATAGIFLALLGEAWTEITIPSIIPPVVANAIEQANCQVSFEDNVNWVGHDYILHQWPDRNLIDSAQRVVPLQFSKEANDNDLMLFSFFPTKPVGSCDGGMIVSNDQHAIEKIRILANNGMTGEGPSWDKQQEVPGFKLYMNSISAWIANENLKKLDQKNQQLDFVRQVYNHAFGLNNTSRHLYRVPVKDNAQFALKASFSAEIQCGIHYRPLHLSPVFREPEQPALPNSEVAGRTMVSIPYHEKLTDREIKTVIDFVNENR